MTMPPCIGTALRVAARAAENPHVTATAAAVNKESMGLCINYKYFSFQLGSTITLGLWDLPRRFPARNQEHQAPSCVTANRGISSGKKNNWLK